MEKEKQLTFIDEEGNEILCEILFTFDSEEFKKSYVLFYPIGDAEEDQIEVMAASYAPGEDGDGELFAVESEEEWEMIESVLQSFDEEDEDEEDEDEEEKEEEDEECDCEDGECNCEEGECDCDEDECEDKESEGCGCGNHHHHHE